MFFRDKKELMLLNSGHQQFGIAGAGIPKLQLSGSNFQLIVQCSSVKNKEAVDDVIVVVR